MNDATEWKWSADPMAERAAVKAWNDAANEGGMPGYCDAVARAAVTKYINDRANDMGRPESSKPPRVTLRGPRTMRDINAALRAYETLYGVKANVAVGGRWVDKGDPVVLTYEHPHVVKCKGDTFEVALSVGDTSIVRPEAIDGAIFVLTPKEKP